MPSSLTTGFAWLARACPIQINVSFGVLPGAAKSALPRRKALFCNQSPLGFHQRLYWRRKQSQQKMAPPEWARQRVQSPGDAGSRKEMASKMG